MHDSRSFSGTFPLFQRNFERLSAARSEPHNPTFCAPKCLIRQGAEARAEVSQWLARVGLFSSLP